MKKLLLLIMLAWPSSASNFTVEQYAGYFYRQLLEKTQTSKDNLIDYDILFNLTKEELDGKMRNHHVKFLKALKTCIINDKYIKEITKHKIFEALTKLTICAPVNDYNQFELFYVDTKKEVPLNNNTVLDESPLIISAFQPEIEKEAPIREIIEQQEKAEKPALKKNKKPVKKKRLKKKKISKKTKLEKKVNALPNKFFSQIELSDDSDDSSEELTLEELRTEILLGFYEYELFEEFKPSARTHQSHFDFFQDLVNEFFDELEEAENYVQDKIYINKGFSAQIFYALDALSNQN